MSAPPRLHPSRKRSRRRSCGEPLSEESLRVAFVCTGNRFRSPLAAALLAEQAKELPVAVASLGTLELGPVPALPEAVKIAESYGLDLSGHRAQNIAAVDLEACDLVLGFERMHMAAAVVDGGARLERTFTLPELLDLLDGIPEPPPQAEAMERARERIQHAHAARPRDHRANAVPEIADPLGKTEAAQRRTAEDVRALVTDLSRRLFA
jgi:protein-tyrosine phosphatase